MDLSRHINTDKFNGLIVIGDIHSNYNALVQALTYAETNNLFVVFIGDILDGLPYPIETANLVKHALDTNVAALTIGNHDDKWYRYSIGNNVMLRDDQLNMLSNCDNAKELTGLMRDICTHPNADYYHEYKSTVFVHAAAHLHIWEQPGIISPAVKSMALYGEVTQEADDDGMPLRFYNWVDHVPKGRVAVVGHDRNAMNKSAKAQLKFHNELGGTVHFIDTGSGKSEVYGPLTGAVFYISNCDITFVHYKEFVCD